MKKIYLTLSLFLIGILTLNSVVFAAEGITYDFDEVNVLYATEFTAKPIDGTDYKNTWVADISGDNPQVTVTYGVVELKKGGEVLVTEEFLKVSGDKDSKRFLLNSATYDYYEGTSKYSKIKSFFWSAKKLEGTSVVKDFAPPIYSSSFSRKFDEAGNRYSFYLSFSNDGEKAGQEFRQGDTPMYEADISSIRESGDAKVKSS